MKPRDENKILDIYRATLELVKETGLAGITMGQIAKEAGLATGTVYIYFNNKEDLIVQGIKEGLATLKELGKDSDGRLESTVSALKGILAGDSI